MAALLWTTRDFRILENAQEEIAWIKGLPCKKELFGSHHLETFESLCVLGYCHYKRRQQTRNFETAEKILSSIVTDATVTIGRRHEVVAEAMTKLSIVKSVMGQFEEAIQLYNEQIPLLQKLLGLTHAKVVMAMANMGACLINSGKKDREDEAATVLDQARTLAEDALPQNHPLLAYTYEWAACAKGADPIYKEKAAHIRQATGTHKWQTGM